MRKKNAMHIDIGLVKGKISFKVVRCNDLSKRMTAFIWKHDLFFQNTSQVRKNHPVYPNWDQIHSRDIPNNTGGISKVCRTRLGMRALDGGFQQRDGKAQRWTWILHQGPVKLPHGGYVGSRGGHHRHNASVVLSLHGESSKNSGKFFFYLQQ